MRTLHVATVEIPIRVDGSENADLITAEVMFSYLPSLEVHVVSAVQLDGNPVGGFVSLLAHARKWAAREGYDILCKHAEGEP